MTARSTSENGGAERCATFVVIVRHRKRDGLAGQDLLPASGNSNRESDIGARPATWTSRSGRVIARVWPESELHQGRQGLNAVVGWPLRMGDRVVGHFSDIALDPAGRGTIRQDPCGIHPLYTGAARGITVIANRPYLVAAVLEKLTGQRLRRDGRFAAWLALSGYPIGDRTGYEQVRCVPVGATVRIGRCFRVTLRPARPPWILGKIDNADSLIDQIESELIDNLRGAIAAMGHRPRLQLTGGRDSRLVLALALRGGVLREVEIVTLGDRGAPDATVARELTARLGIGHTQLEWRDGVVVRRQLCPHVGSVAGAVSCIDSSLSLSTDGRMTISGLTGEMLRTNWPLRTGYDDERSAVAGFLSMPLGAAGLLKREACIDALTDGIGCLLEPTAQGAAPQDLFDAYYVQHRLRRWLAARPERFADEFFPLYHPPAIELAFRMGWRARTAGRIHDAIIERAGSLVSGPPYYKPGGFYKPEIPVEPSEEILRQQHPPRIRKRIVGRFLRPQRPPDALYQEAITKWISVAHEKRPQLSTVTGVAPEKSLSRRQLAYRELILARRDNAIFEFLDQDRLLKAVDALPNLSDPAASQVHGAMTGVIWLGRLEKEF